MVTFGNALITHKKEMLHVIMMIYGFHALAGSALVCIYNHMYVRGFSTVGISNKKIYEASFAADTNRQTDRQVKARKKQSCSRSSCISYS